MESLDDFLSGVHGPRRCAGEQGEKERTVAGDAQEARLPQPGEERGGEGGVGDHEQAAGAERPGERTEERCDQKRVGGELVAEPMVVEKFAAEPRGRPSDAVKPLGRGFPSQEDGHFVPKSHGPSPAARVHSGTVAERDGVGAGEISTRPRGVFSGRAWMGAVSR